MQTIVKERKLGFWDFINEGLRIFVFRIKDFSLLALGSIIPSTLLLALASEEFSSSSTETNIIKIAILFSILILQVLIGLVVSMSSAIITENIIEGKSISLADSIKLAASKWGRAFTTQLLAFIIIFGLTLLLFIPGFIYSIYYIFALYVVALRDKGGTEALKYSKTLVEGQWWRIFWILLGIAIIFGIINGAFTILFGLISDNPYFAIIPNAVTLYIASILGIINIVIFLNMDFVYHRRLEKRKEMEKAKKVKKAQSIEEYVKGTKSTPVKRPTIKNTPRKPGKAATKRNTRKKE
jgi:uncharacterized membrane protein